jgi:hypothetical protein
MIVVLVASCDLLKTRGTETPVGGNPANPPATSAQMVIDNLTSSFANKNVNDYDKLLADTGSVKKQYIFVPTQKAAGNYSAFFSHWTRDSELNYFRKAMASVSVAFAPTVSFSGPTLTNFQADSALYAADYSFFLSPTTYLGRARFYMIPNKNTGTWAIYRWEDLPSAKDSTLSWSDMKGQFSQ